MYTLHVRSLWNSPSTGPSICWLKMHNIEAGKWSNCLGVLFSVKVAAITGKNVFETCCLFEICTLASLQIAQIESKILS